MCNTNQISKYFRKLFFIKGQKSRLQNEGFFCWKRQKKTGDAKVDNQKIRKPIATIRKDKRNKTKCAHTVKIQEEKGRKTDEKKGYTKEVFKKEAREIF